LGSPVADVPGSWDAPGEVPWTGPGLGWTGRGLSSSWGPLEDTSLLGSLQQDPVITELNSGVGS